MRVAIPIIDDKGVQFFYSPHFGSAPFFAFIDVEQKQVVNFYVKANEGAKLPHKKGIQAADLLVEQHVDVVLAMDVGEGPFHILSDNLICMNYLPRSVEI